jgi:hypothetical protein
MEDIPLQDWTYFFIHQTDKRPFNRGGMKNIGFLAFKEKYPNDYKNIIFIFNDIDTLPYDKNILNYHTDFGVIKHFYGFHFALGGIFSIRGVDFERINGFPNYWAWGGEDNVICKRATDFGLIIDRSNFYKIGDMNILQFADGFKRPICRDELATSIIPNYEDGISKITNLNFTIYNDTHMIDVIAFDTFISCFNLNFENETLDKLSKIRVSPLNAVHNIKELNSKYTLDVNKNLIHKNNNNNNNNNNNPIVDPGFLLQSPMNQFFRTNMFNHKQPTITPPVPVIATPSVSIPLQSYRRFGMRGLFM